MNALNKKPTCERCGGNILWDAWAEFVPGRGEELHSSVDDYICEVCEESNPGIVWKDAEPTEILPAPKDTVRTLAEALRSISGLPANSNSDPDTMGEALDEAIRIATNAVTEFGKAGEGV